MTLHAQMRLVPDGQPSDPPDAVAAHEVTTEWDSEAMWDSPWDTPGGDFQPDPVAVVDTPGGATDTFDVTGLAQRWVADATERFGVMVKADDEDAAGELSYVLGGSLDDDRPRLTVRWTPRAGDRHGATLEQFDLPGAETALVDVASGMLTLQAADVQIAGTAGLDLTAGRTVTDVPATSAGAFGQQVTSMLDSRIRVYSSNTVVFQDPTGGQQVAFTRAVAEDHAWEPVQRIDATLTGDVDSSVVGGGGTLELEWHHTGETLTYENLLLSQVADRNGNQITFSYTSQVGWPARIASVTDTQGRVTTAEHEHPYCAPRVVGLTDPAGREHTYTYDGDGNNGTRSHTDPDGNTTEVATVTNPDGTESTVTVTNAAGDQLIIDRAASTGSSVWRVKAVTLADADGANADTWTFAYDFGERETVVTDPRGNDTTYEYNTSGYVETAIDANGHEQASEYDSQGNVEAATSARGNVTTSTYDEANNLTSQVLPTGGESVFAYEDGNNAYAPSEYTRPQGTVTSYSYDEAGNLATIEPDDGGEDSYDYNTDGTVASQTNPNGSTTSYSYDSNGNLATVSPPDPMGETTYTYDQLSRPIRTTDGNGDTTTYRWDVLDRIVQISYDDGQTIAYTYDDVGNQTELTDGWGTTEFGYDHHARLVTESRPDGSASAYTYDQVGNLTDVTDANGTVGYAYDAVNLLTALDDVDGQTITFGYDEDNQRTETDYPNGVTQQAAYDDAGRLQQIYGLAPPDGSNGTPRLAWTSYDYSYDVDGEDTLLRSEVTDHHGVTTGYTYDSQDRLTQADLADSDGPTVSYSYEYDPASNRSESAVTDHQAGTIETTSYSYNDADQLTRTSDGVAFTYDDAGQLTGDSDGMAIGYDAGQRTTSITPADATTPTVDMEYTGATQASRTAAGATAFTNTLLGVADETTNDATTVFTRDHEGTLTSLPHPTDGTFYYLFDGLGSVIGLTDQDGALVNEYDYDPYGVLTDHTEQVHNPWRYTGEYHDQQTGLYKIGERYLDPEHGRWTQRDPLEGRTNFAMPGETNPYTQALKSLSVIPARVGVCGTGKRARRPASGRGCRPSWSCAGS